jgi:hypothetical protein
MVQAATSLVACLYTNTVHYTAPPPNKVCALANMSIGAIHAPTDCALPDQRCVVSTYWVQQCVLHH